MTSSKLPRSLPRRAEFDALRGVDWVQRLPPSPVNGADSRRYGPALEVRHEGTSHRIRPMRHRRTGPHRPTRRSRRPGVTPERIYVDHGLTGCNRDRPGLREALAACRDVDTLVVTKLDRLARSLPDARAIADELTTRRVRLSLAGPSTTPPTRSADCCSTCWPWSPSSRPTSSDYAPRKA